MHQPEFFVTLVCFCDVLSTTAPLSRFLQKKTMHMVQANNAVLASICVHLAQSASFLVLHEDAPYGDNRRVRVQGQTSGIVTEQA